MPLSSPFPASQRYSLAAWAPFAQLSLICCAFSRHLLRPANPKSEPRNEFNPFFCLFSFRLDLSYSLMLLPQQIIAALSPSISPLTRFALSRIIPALRLGVIGGNFPCLRPVRQVLANDPAASSRSSVSSSYRVALTCCTAAGYKMCIDHAPSVGSRQAVARQ